MDLVKHHPDSVKHHVDLVKYHMILVKHQRMLSLDAEVKSPYRSLFLGPSGASPGNRGCGLREFRRKGPFSRNQYSDLLLKNPARYQRAISTAHNP